jgi:hypothetical protein
MKTNPNDPISPTEASNGLRKREEFALQFAKELIPQFPNIHSESSRRTMMALAVDMADDLCDALNK